MNISHVWSKFGLPTEAINYFNDLQRAGRRRAPRTLRSQLLMHHCSNPIKQHGNKEKNLLRSLNLSREEIGEYALTVRAGGGRES